MKKHKLYMGEPELDIEETFGKGRKCQVWQMTF